MLAARQLGRSVGEPVSQLDDLEHLAEPVPIRASSGQPGRKGDVLLGSILAGLALLVGTVQIISVLARETITETVSFPADGVRLVDVRAPNGSVEIRGSTTDEISLTARIGHGLRRTGHRGRGGRRRPPGARLLPAPDDVE